jgi:hypothetical protein
LRFDIAWYSGFWDVPRLFSVRVDGGYLLFDCEFDDVVDDYSSVYRVTLVRSESELTSDATRSAAETSPLLGEVPVADINFDESRRRFVEIPDRIGGHATRPPSG